MAKQSPAIHDLKCRYRTIGLIAEGWLTSSMLKLSKIWNVGTLRLPDACQRVVATFYDHTLTAAPRSKAHSTTSKDKFYDYNLLDPSVNR